MTTETPQVTAPAAAGYLGAVYFLLPRPRLRPWGGRRAGTPRRYGIGSASAL
jgi:hypothetical protein